MMPSTDQQDLDQPVEIRAAQITAKSRRLPFVAQVVAMSAFFAACMLAFACWQAGSVELVQPWLRGERLVFQPTRIDFGQVPPNQTLEREIRVVNLSSRSVTMLGSQPSCGCISLDEFPIVIAAGKSHLLKLKIAIPSKLGSFDHFIRFFSNDQNSSKTVVTVSGVVQ